MKLERDTLFLDVETTGVDPMIDRIVELALVRINTEGEVARLCERFNPQRPIPAEATAVHGITDADVANCPTFGKRAGELLLNFVGANYCGYNLRRLDLPILDEEFRRAGIRLPFDGVLIFDCYGIFAKRFPKTLADAVRVFCGREHTGSHSALADVLATIDVLDGQMNMFPELGKMPMVELARYSNHGDVEYVDLAGKLYRDKDNDLRYAFGKVKDVKVRDDLGYAKWMLTRASFPGNTNDVLNDELSRIENEMNGGTLFPDNPGEPF